jgi:hypothetical protein
MPTALRDVRSQGQSGKHMLALSFSGFDPTLTLATLPRKQKLGSESKVFGRKWFGRLT